MADPVFNDKISKPDHHMLAEKMGNNFRYWEEIRRYLKSQYNPVMEEWKFYDPKYGWRLKNQLKKRNMFF